MMIFWPLRNFKKRYRLIFIKNNNKKEKCIFLDFCDRQTSRQRQLVTQTDRQTEDRQTDRQTNTQTKQTDDIQRFSKKGQTNTNSSGNVSNVSVYFRLRLRDHVFLFIKLTPPGHQHAPNQPAALPANRAVGPHSISQKC
jgi:IS1 family transposase